MEQTISQLLREQLIANGEALTIGDVITATEKQGFGLLFIVFALPVLVPLPPGVGAVPGLLLILWGLQRLLGRANPWIPARVARKKLTPKMTGLLFRRALPILERLERYCPRGTGQERIREWESRLASIIVIFMGFLVLLPTPFLNTLPAVIIIATGLAFVNGHRITLWTSMVLGIVVFAAIGATIVFGGERLLEEIMDEDLLPAGFLTGL